MKSAAENLVPGLTWEQSALRSAASYTGPPSFVQLFNLFDQFLLNQVHFVLFGSLQGGFLSALARQEVGETAVPRTHIGRSHTILCLFSGRLKRQEPVGVEEEVAG